MNVFDVQMTPVRQDLNHKIFKTRLGTSTHKNNQYPPLSVFAAAHGRCDWLRSEDETSANSDLCLSPLVAAVMNNRVDTIKLFLTRSNVNKRYTVQGDKCSLSGLEGGSLLSIAAQLGNLKMFEYLCGKGAVISIDVIETILRHGKVDILDFSLKRVTVKLEGVLIAGQHPLLYALDHDFRELVGHLLTKFEAHTLAIWPQVLQKYAQYDYEDAVYQALRTHPVAENRELWQPVLARAARYGKTNIYPKRSIFRLLDLFFFALGL